MGGKMRLVIEVDGQVIAETSDLGICATALRLIDAEGKGDLENVLGTTVSLGDQGTSGDSAARSAESRIADDLGIQAVEVMGAIDPTDDPPYIRVNKRNWEALVRTLPNKGPGSAAPFAILMTILGVWKEYAHLSNPTYKEAAQVFRALGLQDKNRRRAIANCDWLIERGNEVVLNPAEMSNSLEVIRLLCTKGRRTTD